MGMERRAEEPTTPTQPSGGEAGSILKPTGIATAAVSRFGRVVNAGVDSPVLAIRKMRASRLGGTGDETC